MMQVRSASDLYLVGPRWVSAVVLPYGTFFPLKLDWPIPFDFLKSPQDLVMLTGLGLRGNLRFDDFIAILLRAIFIFPSPRVSMYFCFLCYLLLWLFRLAY